MIRSTFARSNEKPKNRTTVRFLPFRWQWCIRKWSKQPLLDKTVLCRDISSHAMTKMPAEPFVRSRPSMVKRSAFFQSMNFEGQKLQNFHQEAMTLKTTPKDSNRYNSLFALPVLLWPYHLLEAIKDCKERPVKIQREGGPVIPTPKPLVNTTPPQTHVPLRRRNHGSSSFNVAIEIVMAMTHSKVLPTQEHHDI